MKALIAVLALSVAGCATPRAYIEAGVAGAYGDWYDAGEVTTPATVGASWVVEINEWYIPDEVLLEFNHYSQLRAGFPYDDRSESSANFYEGRARWYIYE